MKQVAILLATYNGKKYLGKMLASLESQTYQQFVCYIHDDGSTDGTMDVMEEWISEHGGKYRILEGPAQGSPQANFLWMLSQAEADYYMFADQDDVWLPEKIEKTVDKFSEIEAGVEGPICVFSDMYVVDEGLQIMSQSFIRYIDRDPKRTALSQLLMENPAAGCTQLFNRELRDLALQLQDMEQIEMHDIWVLALAAAFGQDHVGVVDEPLVYYRQHGDNEMGAVAESRLQKVIRNIRLIFSGAVFEKKRVYIQQARDLAGQLALVDGLPEEMHDFLKEFADIGSRGKLARVRFYRKHHITKNHGTLWLYLWV
ncbi:MAG: glycosyltransferase family 2 protein [Lachnospiraceae bacterium]|nr:glycosyltransferase family 2 protein [Lachnospiraceae bacterium]